MKKPKLRELKEAIRAVIKGPYTSRFPFEPVVATETFRGKPQYNEEECVGCGACAVICPAEAIELIDSVDGEPSRKLIVHYDNCIFCQQCERHCITEGGIKLTQEYDLATSNRSEAMGSVEKSLLLCENCRSVITTIDHLRWLAKRLGPLAFSNPNLILATHDELALIENSVSLNPKEKGDRSDIIRVLCPKCRGEVYLTEEWGK